MIENQTQLTPEEQLQVETFCPLDELPKAELGKPTINSGIE